jgi:NADH:ubiquinone oxidoreductase subunit 6 (subunit J)
MSTEEILVNVVFYLFAAGAVVAAIAVALSQNIIRSAFALLGVLFAAAALYAFMRADFVVAAQIIIYVGGILVLIIFAVMLTHKITDVHASNESVPGPAAVFASLCVLFALVVIIGTWRWDREALPDPVKGDERLLAGMTKEAVARVVVKLSHPDKTGIHPGDLLAGTIVHVDATVAQAPEGAVAARLELLHAPTPGRNVKDPPPPVWTSVAHADLLMSAGSGTLRAANLQPGDYRWRMSFSGADGPLVLGRIACRICSAAGKTGEACKTSGCEIKEGVERPQPRPYESLALGACRVCGATGTAGAACATAGCRQRGKPIDAIPWTILGTPFHAEAGLTRPLGMALMNRYLLPFEVISVLLLASLVGAAYLARKEVKGT